MILEYKRSQSTLEWGGSAKLHHHLSRAVELVFLHCPYDKCTSY